MRERSSVSMWNMMMDTKNLSNIETEIWCPLMSKRSDPIPVLENI